ncbi:hypothetical protein AcW1_001541 [Taiwanofungus camphoratus]|nr:hypothetical protein AcW1_001541 [Antrodia cinnamomea]
MNYFEICEIKSFLCDKACYVPQIPIRTGATQCRVFMFISLREVFLSSLTSASRLKVSHFSRFIKGEGVTSMYCVYVTLLPKMPSIEEEGSATAEKTRWS